MCFKGLLDFVLSCVSMFSSFSKFSVLCFQPPLVLALMVIFIRWEALSCILCFIISCFFWAACSMSRNPVSRKLLTSAGSSTPLYSLGYSGKFFLSLIDCRSVCPSISKMNRLAVPAWGMGVFAVQVQPCKCYDCKTFCAFQPISRPASLIPVPTPDLFNILHGLL